VHPKGYQQFEAIAYQRGADGKSYTGDDVDLGPVDATWSVEEFYSVYGDDDKDFVGTLNASGFFTPALGGPNPQRKFSRNNYGDVWISPRWRNDRTSGSELSPRRVSPLRRRRQAISLPGSRGGNFRIGRCGRHAARSRG
jgi:quinohemoprotein amine dehydrogenase